VAFEGEDEVGDAANDHQPAEDECDGEAGDTGNAKGEESGEDEQDAKGYGPVDGLGNISGEGGWGCAHVAVLQRVVETGNEYGRKNSIFMRDGVLAGNCDHGIMTMVMYGG
jgi:hypothetical protein